MSGYVFPLVLEAAAGAILACAPGMAVSLAGLGLHAAAAVLGGRTFVRRVASAETEGWRSAAFPTVLGLTVPPVGIVFLWVYVPLTRSLRDRVVRRTGYEVFERKTIAAYRRSPQHVETAAAVPLVEVIRKGAADARLRAVIALRRAKLNPRSATTLLREALDTGINELEIIASTSLAEMEEEIDQVLGGLIKKAEESNLATDYNAVARHFHEYGYMGLAEGALRKFYLETGIGCFEHSLELDPNQPDVRIELVRYYVECGRFEDAVAQFDAAVATGYSKPKGYFYLAEVYYRQKRWNELLTLCQWLNLQRVPDKKITEICSFWDSTCVPTFA